MTDDQRLQIALGLLDKRSVEEYIEKCREVELLPHTSLPPDGTTLYGAKVKNETPHQTTKD